MPVDVASCSSCRSKLKSAPTKDGQKQAIEVYDAPPFRLSPTNDRRPAQPQRHGIHLEAIRAA